MTWDAAYKDGYETGLDAGRREAVEWMRQHEYILVGSPSARKDWESQLKKWEIK